MSETLDIDPIDPSATKLHRAGDIEWFPSGNTMYLAPLPLPTDASPHSPYVSDLNDTYWISAAVNPKFFHGR
ncbi:hypothetical protein [Pseudomonas frederiksbergensis]|uniref:hypothetical protein n=1 Tax=Pseudomonas frederiksbergensis TaxID=104087 RepID=UPI003D2512B5